MKKNLNIEWLLGFIDGDGYFGLEKMKNKRNGKIYIFYRPILAISQNDITVLYKIKSFVGCGSVSSKGKSKKHYHYRIRSASLLKQYFFPLIKNYTFQTNKQLQLKILKIAVTFLTTTYSPLLNKHNLFLEKLDQKLRHLKTVNYLNKHLISLNWFIGFFEAEGTLYFNMHYEKPRFFIKVTQKNKPLLLKIQNFFKYGSIQKERESIYYFGISSQSDLNKIFVIFEQNFFYSKKNLYRIKWLKAFRIISKAKVNKQSISQKQIQKLNKLTTVLK